VALIGERGNKGKREEKGGGDATAAQGSGRRGARRAVRATGDATTMAERRRDGDAATGRRGGVGSGEEVGMDGKSGRWGFI
jgi:hypothetical protein